MQCFLVVNIILLKKLQAKYIHKNQTLGVVETFN